MTTPTVERNLLDLHVPVDPDGTAAATAPIAWCVTKALMAEVAEKGFKNPHLLVINRVKKSQRTGNLNWTDYEDKWAVFIPLANAMAYVSFTAPGENELHAYVVDIVDKHDAKVARKFSQEIERWRGYEFGSCIRDDNNGLEFEKLSLRMLRRTSEDVTVQVPAEMFAPPPAEWRKKIVRRFFTKKEADQCHFRKRFLLAAPLSLVLAPVLYLIKAIATLFYYAFGGRGFVLRVFKQPLEWPSALWKHSPAQWFAPWENKEHKDQLSVWTVLNAPVLGGLALLFWGFTSIGWVEVLKIAVMIALMGALVVGAATLASSDRVLDAWAKWRDGAEEKKRVETLHALESMLCETNLPANSLKDLPREKRTFELRFYDFKTKVCKPFAR